MWTQFAVAKVAIGARNIGQAPTHTAMPRVTITSPRYIGLRVKRYGPLVTRLRLVGEVGLTSVPSRRNMMMAEIGRIQGTVTSAMPSGGSGKPGISGQPSSQLIATARSTKTSAQMGGGSLSMAEASVVHSMQHGQGGIARVYFAIFVLWPALRGASPLGRPRRKCGGETLRVHSCDTPFSHGELCSRLFP